MLQASNQLIKSEPDRGIISSFLQALGNLCVGDFIDRTLQTVEQAGGQGSSLLLGEF
jgi:hypothetical protein